MHDLESQLKDWGDEISNVKLPRWDELPDFHIYLEQLIGLINDYLSFSQVDNEKLLTSAMINNYVKLKIIPKPIKKRYSRIHLAHLIIIILLKGVLPINDIKKGLSMQVIAFKGDYRAAYNLFCKQYEITLHYIGKVAKGQSSNDHLMEKLPYYMLGTYMATLSVVSQLFSQKVLSILENDVTNRSRHQNTSIKTEEIK